MDCGRDRRRLRARFDGGHAGPPGPRKAPNPTRRIAALIAALIAPLAALAPRGSRVEARLLRRRSGMKSVSRRSVLIARSAHGGWRSLATAFLARSQTKDMSARSLVQDSGAPAWLSTVWARSE